MSLPLGQNKCQQLDPLQRASVRSRGLQDTMSSNSTAAPATSHLAGTDLGSVATRFNVRSAKTLPANLGSKKNLEGLRRIFENEAVVLKNEEPGGRKTALNELFSLYHDRASETDSRLRDNVINKVADCNVDVAPRGRARSKSLGWRLDLGLKGTVSDSIPVNQSGSFEAQKKEENASENRALGKDSSEFKSVLSRVQAYNALSLTARRTEKNISSLGESEMGAMPLKFVQISHTLEQTSGGRSLNSQLKPMENQSSKDEGTYSRLQTQDDSGLGRSELRLCFTDTKAVGSELKELTRSQNLVEQVRTQNSTQDLVGAKCNSTPTTSSGSAQNLSESKSAINSTFGPASLSPLSHWRSQESDGVSSVLNDTESSVAHWSKDRPAMRDTLFQPPLRKASENTQGKEYGAHRDLCTMSLGRAKSKNFVLTSNATSRCIKQNVKGNFTAGYDCKSQKTSAGTHSDSHGDEDVFDSQPLRATKRQDKKLLHSPSLDSVQSTIHKFEALAQQLKPVQQQRSRRALSVPANSNSEGGKRSRTDVTLAVRGDWDNGGMRKTSIERGIFMRSSSVDEAGLRKNACERSDSITQLPQHKPQNEPHTFRVRTKEDIHTDEPDFSISRARTKPINKEWINGSMRYSSLPQQPNSSDKSTTTEEDGDKTPTNSPFTLPLVSPLQAHLQSLTPIRAQNPQEDTILLPKKITDHNKSTVNSPPSSQPDLSTPVPVTCSSPNDCPPLNRLVLLDKTVDSGPLSTSVARWSSEEEDSEDYDDDDEDSDCESTVTITSQVSKSDRRSFSLSLADLCNAGGLDYCLPDDTGSNPGEYGSHRSASMSSDISGLSCVTLLGTEELENLLQDVCSLGDDTLQNYDEVKVVVLHKDVGSGLGFTMAGGVDQNKPITVHKVFPHGAAAQEGSICEGDQVLSINGTALQDAGHSEAIHTLRKARGQGTAVVVLKRDKATEQHRKRNGTKGHTGTGTGNSFPSLSLTQQGTSGQRIKLVLQKRTFDLGFSLEGGVASSLGDKPLTVQKLFQGGPVGQVLPGDEILEVQGKSLAGLRRLEAWQLIKKLPPGPVEVILHRPPLQLH